MTPKETAAQSGRMTFLLSVEHALRQGKSCTLLGGRKVGKTFLAHHIERQLAGDFLVVFADLERMALTPEHFSLALMGKALSAAVRAPREGLARFEEMPFLLSLEKEMGKTAYGLLKAAENELQKIKPDQRLLVQNAWWFCHAVAAHSGKKTLIILDNAEYLTELNNFSQVGDVFSLLPLKEKEFAFLLTSSAVSEMKQHSAFEHFAIPPSDGQEIKSIARQHAPKADRKTVDGIGRLSSGHPFIAEILAKRSGEWGTPEKAFAAELLGKEGALYRYGEDAFRYYYSRTRGQTLIRLILTIISKEELRLSEIARKIYRSAPVTKSLLERLMAVDAVEKRGKVFAISDPVLGLWLRMIAGGKDLGGIDDRTLEEFSKEVLKDLQWQRKG
ncbi:MAG: ATPase [archaeon GW2011_AR11]|nr:MAG: ATPase [archaeon GW2011_AR11]